MKTNAVILFVALTLTYNQVCANDQYVEAMQKNIQMVYDGRSAEEIQNAVNTFERIGNAEKDKWEPFYYASFGYIMMATREQEPARKDVMLDKASEILKKAAGIQPNESEIVALEGFIYMMKVTVDPAIRGQQYSGLAMQAFGKALGMNPENPRAMALMAQMEFGTAQFFKSSTTNACSKANLAIEKFENFKSDNALAPRWGKEMSLSLLKNCE